MTTSKKCPSFRLYDDDISEHPNRDSSLQLKENSKKVDDQNEDGHQRRDHKNMKYLRDHDQSKLDKGMYSTVDISEEARFPGDRPQYETSGEWDENNEHGNSIKHLKVSWPDIAENQHRDSTDDRKAEVTSMKSHQVERRSLLGKGKHLLKHVYINDSVVQTARETKIDEDSSFNESVEELLPATYSVSDEDLVEIPLPRLRPRTDSLYTLRSCLSMSLESLSKTADEAIDAASRSEESTETSGQNTKLHRSRRNNNNKLFQNGDDNESCSEATIDHNYMPESRSNNRLSLVTYHHVSASDLDKNKPKYCSKDVSQFQPNLICSITSKKDIFIDEMQKRNGDKADLIKRNDEDAEKINDDKAEIEIIEKNSADTRMVSCVSKLQEECDSTTAFTNRNRCLHSDRFNNKPQSSTTDPEEKSDNQCLDQYNTNCNTNILVEASDYCEEKKEPIQQPSTRVEIKIEGRNQVEEVDFRQFTNNKFQNDNNSAGTSNVGHSLRAGTSEKALTVDDTSTGSKNSGKRRFHFNTIGNKKLAYSGKNKMFGNQRSISFKSDVSDSGENLAIAKIHSTKQRRCLDNYPSTYIGDILYSNNEEYQEDIVNNFDVISTDFIECSNAEQSKRDIEDAVQNWVYFYDIDLPRTYKHFGNGISSTNKSDKFKVWSQNDSILPIPGHSMPYWHALVRARQNWFDFYGIKVPEMDNRNYQPNRHLISVPKYVRDEKDNSFDDKRRNEWLNRTKDNSKQTSPFFHGASSDLETKISKRLKSLIEFERMEQRYTFSDDTKNLSRQVCQSKSTSKGFIQSVCFNTDLSTLPIEEGIHKCVASVHQNIRPKFYSSTTCTVDSVVNASTFNSHSKSNSVNETCLTSGLGTVSTNKENKTNKTSEETSTKTVDAAATEQIQIIAQSPSPESNFTSATILSDEIESSKTLARLAFEKAETFETEVIMEKTCTENSPTTFGNGTDLQMENTALKSNDHSINGSEESVELVPVSTKEKSHLTEFSKQREVTQIIKSNEKEKHSSELSPIMSDVVDLNSVEDADYYNVNNSPNGNPFIVKENNISVVVDKPINGLIHTEDTNGLKENINSDHRRIGHETTMTTFQMFENMSITCRALLAELGIYQDILSGVIPLDMNKVLRSELNNSSTCPDCERRERERMQKKTGVPPNLTKDGGCSIDNVADEDDEAENKTTNAKLFRMQFMETKPTTMSSDFADLSVVNEETDNGSTEARQGSSIMMEDIEDGDTASGLSTTSISWTLRAKDYILKSVPWRLPRGALISLQKFNFEELKSRDPELSILMSLLCIVFLQLICWLPITISNVLFDVTKDQPKRGNIELVFLLLWCCRLAVQPWLYACYSKYFRENYIQLLCCQFCR